MGKEFIATKDDWQKVIDECKKQFKLMDNTTREMAFARIVQDHLYKFAIERLKDFPCNIEKKGKV